MSDRRRRIVKQRRSAASESPEMRMTLLEGRVEALNEYVVTELGEDGEFQNSLCVFLVHLTATLADIRDAAMVANANLYAGNIRDGVTAFFDVIETVCDVTEKVNMLKTIFPDQQFQIEQLMRPANRGV